MAEIFLFVGASSGEYHQSSGLRYLGLREETAYGAVSSQPSYTLAFNTLSPRVSSRNQTAGRIMPAGRTRNLQLSTPLIFDGRYQMSPDISEDTIIQYGKAQQALMGMLLKRKVDVTQEKFHPCNSLGDLSSWNCDLAGSNIGDSRTYLGIKSTGFTLSTSGSGLSPMPWSLTGQFQFYGSEQSTFEGSAPANWISPRLEMPTYNLCASTIRVTDADIDLNSNLNNSIVLSPTQVRIQCRRTMARGNPYGHVSPSGEINARGVFPLSETWNVSFSAPAWKSGPTRYLVQKAHTLHAEQNRYNVRVDIGGTSGALYKALTDSDTAALHVPVWGEPFSVNATGRESARVYAVYASDALVGGVSQYLPKKGDKIRFQSEQGGYVATVGGARMVEGSVSTGFREIQPLSEAEFFTHVTDPWGSCPRPQGHISMWFTDLNLVPPDNRVELVPMGMYFEFRNVVLSQSGGLDNQESKYSLQFSSDPDSQVVAYY